MTLPEFTSLLHEGITLARAQASDAARLIARQDVCPESKEDFLKALAARGEDPEEVAGFAIAYRQLARDSGLGNLTEGAIDIVGTGGDNSGSFNISTFVSILLAADGVRVLKHGNRSITSKCGSADLLEALGIDLDPGPEKIRAAVDALNFAFFFAPSYHPAFKHIAPVRRKLASEGVRTIFNILGPLINPARPPTQLLGCFAPTWVPALAAAQEGLGQQRGLVVHCRLGPEKGMDELSCAGENVVRGVGALSDLDEVWPADAFDLPACTETELAGGEVETNLQIARELARGKGSEGLKSTIILNAAAAFYACGACEDMPSGINRAREVLASKKISAWLNQAHTFFSA